MSIENASLHAADSLMISVSLWKETQTLMSSNLHCKKEKEKKVTFVKFKRYV